jgi:hypothetical protein
MEARPEVGIFDPTRDLRERQPAFRLCVHLDDEDGDQCECRREHGRLERRLTRPDSSCSHIAARFGMYGPEPAPKASGISIRRLTDREPFPLPPVMLIERTTRSSARSAAKPLQLVRRKIELRQLGPGQRGEKLPLLVDEFLP